MCGEKRVKWINKRSLFFPFYSESSNKKSKCQTLLPPVPLPPPPKTLSHKPHHHPNRSKLFLFRNSCKSGTLSLLTVFSEQRETFPRREQEGTWKMNSMYLFAPFAKDFSLELVSFPLKFSLKIFLTNATKCIYFSTCWWGWRKVKAIHSSPCAEFLTCNFFMDRGAYVWKRSCTICEWVKWENRKGNQKLLLFIHFSTPLHSSFPLSFNSFSLNSHRHTTTNTGILQKTSFPLLLPCYANNPTTVCHFSVLPTTWWHFFTIFVLNFDLLHSQPNFLYEKNRKGASESKQSLNESFKL